MLDSKQKQRHISPWMCLNFSFLVSLWFWISKLSYITVGGKREFLWIHISNFYLKICPRKSNNTQQVINVYAWNWAQIVNLAISIIHMSSKVSEYNNLSSCATKHRKSSQHNLSPNLTHRPLLLPAQLHYTSTTSCPIAPSIVPGKMSSLPYLQLIVYTAFHFTVIQGLYNS